MLRIVLIYGAALAAAAIVLQWLEYLTWARVHTGEVYVALIAAGFLGLGVWVGARAFRPRVAGGPFEPNARALAALGITPREYEVLRLIADGRSNKEIARRLIDRFGSFSATLAAPPAELVQVKDVGPSAVAALKTVVAAAHRLSRAELIDRPVMSNWDRLMEYLNAVLARERVEQFRVLFLDTRNRLIADEVQGRGTVGHTPVYPREVVKRALERHATALILVHNHPSGDPTPSQDDIVMTREVQTAARALGITLHDHVIIGNGRWTSLRREGLID